MNSEWANRLLFAGLILSAIAVYAAGSYVWDAVKP